MMDMDLRKRPDRRLSEQGLDVIDEVLANDFVRSLIVHADLERSTDDEMIAARKHVSVLAIEILQIWLRRQHRQLALDGSHLGVAPQRHRAQPGAIDDDVLCQRRQDMGSARKFLVHKIDLICPQIPFKSWKENRRFYQQGFDIRIQVGCVLRRAFAAAGPGRE